LAFLSRYGLVGVIAAGLHALALASLRALQVPIPLANLAGFLLASLWGYVAHAKVSFRPNTGGTLFPRRWLLIQLGVNVALSLLMPWWLGPWATSPLALVLLVFTPTAVNLLVWSLAARHTALLRTSPRGAAPSSRR
jgi:putative flippase GtrA